MNSVAVAGAGLIGRAWAYVFARSGLTVRAWDPDPAVRDRLKADIAAMITETGGDAAIAEKITAAGTLAEALDGADWVQENGPEKVALKQALFAEMDALAAPETILASSSSALVPSAFTKGLKGARRCLVAHPVNPPHLVPVVELCPSPETSPEVMDRAEALFTKAGQAPVRLSREIDGFVLNRLQAAVLAEAFRLVGEGVCSVEGLDITMKHGLGRRWAFMGPLETIMLNAPDGVDDYVRRYGAMLSGLVNDCARGEAFTEETGAKISAAFGEVKTAEDVRRRTAWRDGELAALDRHLRNRNGKR